jgi:penicillin amidase
VKWLWRLLALLIALALGAIAYLWQADRYRLDGTLQLAVLDAPVRVLRDEQGVPYVFAQSIDDAIRAQGFVTAQDRLLQIEFSRYLAHGRLSELIGEAGLESDTALRVAGIPRPAARHARLLGAAQRRMRELYLEGMNAYITGYRDEHPVALRLLGISAEPWTLEDSVTLSYFLNWSSSVNLEAELIAQMIIDRVGPERAAEIAQLTINPDAPPAGQPVSPAARAARVGLSPGDLWDGDRLLPVGSNHWVMSGARSRLGAPILANDPHLDARTLPGVWHPIGFVTPGLRAVGVSGPGLPGLAIARTERIAYGVTNAYGDVVDLFVERQDPARPGYYLEGDRAVPFETIEDVIRVRDRGSATGFREVPLKIRLTRRGPVISDHGMSVANGQLLSLRWSVPEVMRPDDSGGTDLMFARSVAEARDAIGRVNAPYNYVVADVDGNIGHFTAGRVPIRRVGDGSAPLAVTDGEDAWAGMIPWQEMPGVTNPARGWVGNANHRTLPSGYRYAYSTYFAASWRYRRLIELLDAPGVRSAEDHWRFQRDARNMMAAAIVPMLAEALLDREDTRRLGEILRRWNFEDDPAQAAPAIFQATWRQFARMTFADELGPELTARMLGNWYFWQERLVQLALAGSSAWFDDVTTAEVETRDDLFVGAARAAQQELSALLGPDAQAWRWGRLHTLTFFSPLVPGSAVAGILGGGTHAKNGSGETLDRAIYAYHKPYATKTIASMRFVADLADPDKVMTVLAGGASGRQFSAHFRDQTPAWLSGEPRYLWFSDEAIRSHARHELSLTP